MGMKKKPDEDFSLQDCDQEERMKYEIAIELDLYDKVLREGWGGLSAKETGRIGGILSARKKQEKKKIGQ